MDISKINPNKIKRIRKYIKRHVKNLGPDRMGLNLIANLVRWRWFRKYEYQISFGWAKEIVEMVVEESSFMKFYERKQGRMKLICIKQINWKL